MLIRIKIELQDLSLSAITAMLSFEMHCSCKKRTQSKFSNSWHKHNVHIL